MENNFYTDTDERFETRLENLICMAENYVNTNMKHYIAPSFSEKIYFAGPWFTKRGRILYDTCKQVYNTCIDKDVPSVYFPEEHTNDSPYSTFLDNVNHIEECDTVVALVTEKDTGTAWEIGMAYALGKKVILVGYDETTFCSKTNIMLAFAGDCVTIEQLIEIFSGNKYNTLNIQDDWDGLQ